MSLHVDAFAHRAHSLCCSSGSENQETNHFTLITHQCTVNLHVPGHRGLHSCDEDGAS